MTENCAAFAMVLFIDHIFVLFSVLYENICTAGVLVKLCYDHKEDPDNPQLRARKPTLLRSLFTVGLLCKYFDLDRDMPDPSIVCHLYI